MGRALAYRLRADLRRRRATLIALVLLVAVLGGTVLATAAGARRTSTAYERFVAAANPPELLVSPPGAPGADPTPFYEELRALDGVLGIRVFAGLPVLPEAGTPSEALAIPLSGAGVLAALDTSEGAGIARPRVTDGRLPDPARAEEILISARFAQVSGLGVGDVIEAVVVDTELTEEVQVAHRADGEPVRLEVTGIGIAYDEIVPFNELNELGSILAGPRLAAMAPRDRWNFEGAQVDTAPGTDLDELTNSVEALSIEPDLGTGGPVFTSDQRAAIAQVDDAMQPLAVALAVAAAAIAVVAVVAVGQAVARITRDGAEDVEAHRALGLRPRERVAFAAARAGVVGLAGAAGAVAVAVALSPRFPIGVARTAEPDPGVRVDGWVLAAGAVAVATLTTAAAVPGSLLALRRSRRAQRTSRLASRAAARGLGPAGVQGVRFALVGGGARPVPLRSTLAAVVLATTAALAALVYGSSLVRLIDTPERYGQGWDRMVDAQFGPAPVGMIVDALAGVEDVRGIGAGSYGDILVEGRPVPAFDLLALEGEVSVGLAEGRRAVEADEVVLGGAVLDRMERVVGDIVEVDLGEGPQAMRVVGRGVFPSMGQGSFSTTGLGVGAQLAGSTLPSFGAEEDLPPGYEVDGQQFNFVVVDAAGSTTALDAALGVVEAQVIDDGAFAFVRTDQAPPQIRDLDRVRVVPALTAAALALVAVAALAHLLVVSVRERRSELALLRALGFSGRQLRAAVSWQASVIALAAALLGIPLGVAVGRGAWAWFEGGLHTLAPAETPWAWVALSVPVLLGVANVVAAVPGHRARRTSPATLLRAE